jgi:cobalamin biosynthetic protein CobC
MPDFTRHGGNLAQARAVFGDGAEPWLDLSTGINPVAYPGVIACDWQSLPDPAELAELEAVAANHFGVPASLCCAVPGSELGLRLLDSLLGMPGAYFDKSYRTHAAAFAHATPLTAFTSPPVAPLALLLANPNNPDGRVVPIEMLQEWHDWLAARWGWLIVDEAFADVTPALSMAAKIDDARRLIVLRSFGKFFGLAGVRLGFVLAPQATVAKLRRLLGDWPLSSAALAIGRAAYGDRRWIADTRQELQHRAAALDAVLQQCGLQPVGSCPHFRLIETERAGAIFVKFARRNILARPFDYDPRWLRLGVPGSAADLDRVHRALVDG